MVLMSKLRGVQTLLPSQRALPSSPPKAAGAGSERASSRASSRQTSSQSTARGETARKEKPDKEKRRSVKTKAAAGAGKLAKIHEEQEVEDPTEEATVAADLW